VLSSGVQGFRTADFADSITCREGMADRDQASMSPRSKELNALQQKGGKHPLLAALAQVRSGAVVFLLLCRCGSHLWRDSLQLLCRRHATAASSRQHFLRKACRQCTR